MRLQRLRVRHAKVSLLFLALACVNAEVLAMPWSLEFLEMRINGSEQVRASFATSPQTFSMYDHKMYCPLPACLCPKGVR